MCDLGFVLEGSGPPLSSSEVGSRPSTNELARSFNGERARQVQWEGLCSPPQYSLSLFGGGDGGSVVCFSSPFTCRAIRSLSFALENGIK